MKRLLMRALKNKFDMMKEDAKELTRIIEEIFDGEKEVNDEKINRHVRQLFCELQRERIVKVRREENKISGKKIRKYYWSLNRKTIKKEAKQKNKNKDPGEIYKKIPEKAWLSHLYCS